VNIKFPTPLPVLFALLLTGCTAFTPSAGELEQPPQTAATEDKGFLQCEQGKEHWRSAGPPKRGGQLVRSVVAPADHLDVTKTGGQAGAVLPQVNQSLVEARQCHYEDTFMVPAIAKSWEVSPDGTTWTFKLREEARWHNKAPVNGRRFNSGDVAFMIEHHKAEGLQRPFWVKVTHQEPDPQTVVMRLVEPDADFLVQVGHQSNVMLAKEVREQYGDFRSVAIGTGPFMLKDYKVTTEFLLEPNPDYHETGIDGKRLPYIDSVRTIAFGDDASELAALRAGQIDTAKSFGLEKLEADNVRRQRPLNLRIEEQFNPAVLALWFDTAKAPLSDVRVRRAIALGMDAEGFISRYQGGAMRAGFIPAAITEFAWPQEKIKQKLSPDPDRAKRLLAEAGFRTDQKLVLKTGGAYTQDAEVAREQLQAIGVPVDIVIEGRNFSPVFQRSEFDLAIGPPGGIAFSNYWIRQILVGETAPRHVRQLNDPQVESLAVAQSREMEPVKRKVLIDQLQERLYEVVPHVPLITHLYYHPRSCRLRNASLYNPGYNSRMPVEVWLDPTGC